MTAPDLDHPAALTSGCDNCISRRASQAAALCLTARAKPELAAVHSSLLHIHPRLENLLSRAASAARAQRHQEAALLSRDANDLLVATIVQSQNGPAGTHPEGTVLMTLRTHRALTCLAAATSVLITLGFAEEETDPQTRREYIRLALSNAWTLLYQPPSLLAHIHSLALPPCTHPAP